MNWHMAGLGALDFCGAVRVTAMKAAARVVFVHSVVHSVVTSSKTIPFRGLGVVLMEDEDVLWMGQTVGAKEWERIRRKGRMEFAE